MKNPTDTPSCQEFLRKTYEEAAGLSDPEKMQNIDLKYWLAGDILQKTDRMSMAHSLEVRVPFLDRDVFEAVRTLPPEAKFAHGKTKYLFRKVARKYIPEDTAARKKLGFPVPVRVWLRDDDWYGRVKKMFQSPISRQYFHTEKLTRFWRSITRERRTTAGKSGRCWRFCSGIRNILMSKNNKNNPKKIVKIDFESIFGNDGGKQL